MIGFLFLTHLNIRKDGENRSGPSDINVSVVPVLKTYLKNMESLELNIARFLF